MTPASFIVAGNWLYLMLCDVINYNDVISATDSLKFLKDVHFTMYRLWKMLSDMSRPETFGMTLVQVLTVALFIM